MPRPALTQAWLLAGLLATVWTQQPRFTCDTEGHHVICTSDDSRVEFLDETGTWREAHEMCRRRRGFLVPSRAVFNDTVQGELHQWAEELGEFWLGAKYLRNGYYGWLLQIYGDGPSDYELLGSSPESDPANLCGRSTSNNELDLGWHRCNDTSKVVCFSGGFTDAEVRPAGYQPSMSVLYGERVIQPRQSADEVVQVRRASLDRGLNLTITCGPGDSIVKDHFVLGKTQYLSSWWNNNFTITRQMLPLDGGSHLGVGSYWCQRYVEGTVNPVVSGRLHVTTSEDMYVLTVPEGRVVETLRRLFSDGAEYVNRSESGFTDENPGRPGPLSANETIDIVTVLEDFLKSGVVVNQVQFLALYDFPNRRAARQEVRQVMEERQGGRARRMVSLVMESTPPPDSALLREDNIAEIGNSTQSGFLLLEVFHCPDNNVTGRIWSQSSSGIQYTSSEPPCVAPGLSALVERRCRPTFERVGAQWGPFCAAGVCQDETPQCGPPPSVCPSGFTDTTDAYESPELFSGLCIRFLTGVTFEERGSACRRHEPSSRPWFPRQRQSLRLLSRVDQTIWLPYRRLWLRGTLLPHVLDLLNCDDRRNANLSGELNCTIVTPDGWLASSSCTARHTVICATERLSFHERRRTFHRPSASERLCQPYPGLHAAPPETSEGCFDLICSNTSYPTSWSEASSLCTKSRSLASLKTMSQLNAAIRLSRAQDSSARAAVNLRRQNSRVVWGDGTLLSYPALAPDLSTSDQHTHGILDISRGQYDFVRGDAGDVSCALCDGQIKVEPPRIILFYGGAQPGTTTSRRQPIFANVTNIQHLVADWQDALSCFVSTAEIIDASRQTVGCPAGAQDGFMVAKLGVLHMGDDITFIELQTPSVAFGYLTCGILIPELGEQVVSNSLALASQGKTTSVQEYVIGLQGGQWLNTQCDVTFCGAVCPCFNQSLKRRDFLKIRVNENNETEGKELFFIRLMHPIGVTPSDDGRVVEHYYVRLDGLPPRGFRSQIGVSDDASYNSDRLKDSRQRFHEQNLAGTDGMQLLREDFGSRLHYVHDARCCPPERTEEPVTLRWPETCGAVSTSVELCMDGFGRPALRRCRGVLPRGVQWGVVEFPDTKCATASTLSIKLHQLSQVKVTANNSVSVAAELERLTAETTALVQQDLVSTAVTMENIQASLEDRDQALPDELLLLQRSTVATVSHLMDADRSTIADATELLAVGHRVIHANENILIGTFTKNATNMNVTADNVAVRSGAVVGIFSFSKEIAGSSLRTVAESTTSSAVALGVESALLLEGKKPSIPVILLVYRDGRLLHSRGQRVTSQVLSALLPTEGDQTRFQSQVIITFRSRPGQRAPEPVCAFWDTMASQWSTRGCWLESVDTGSDVCRCNHLTNFARIFNYEKDEYLSEAYHGTLNVITYVGSTLSLLGLLLTMLTFVLFKKWRRLRGSKIVMHMSVALTGAYLTFLGSLVATENHVACVCLSALLHFFLLSTFGWMAVEAVFQYIRFVRVVGAYISKFMLKASVLVWGGSLVPVFFVLGICPHCYDGQPDVCWMDFQIFYYAFSLPLVLVNVSNAIMFGLIVYALNCGRQKGLRTNQPERQLAQRRLRVSLITFVLLGLPWVFGFLSIREARLVFSALFCVCSMLQGFAVFLLMVAGERGVRGLWRSLLAGRCCSSGDTDTASNSRPAHSGTDTHRSSQNQQDTQL